MLSLPSRPGRLHLPASLALAAGRGKKKSLGQAFPECASWWRGARGGRGSTGGAGEGRRGRTRARTRPGRGPSMAEPLLRKTLSRLRGREKLPRKKSDAKERGEPGRGRRRGRRAPPSLGGGPRAPRRAGWGDRRSPAEPPADWGGGLGTGRGPGSKGLGGEGRGPLCAPGPGCQRCELLGRPGRGPRP